MQGIKFAILIVALLISACSTKAEVPETPVLLQSSPEATQVTVQTVVPPRYVNEGRLGEIGIAQTYFRIRIGQVVDPEFSFMSKIGGTVEINKILCVYDDGTRLYWKDLMAYGPNKLGRCIGAFTVQFYGLENDVEELNIPVLIDVVKEGSG